MRKKKAVTKTLKHTDNVTRNHLFNLLTTESDQNEVSPPSHPGFITRELMSKNKAKNVTATRTQNAGALAHVHVLRCLHGAGSPPANVSAPPPRLWRVI